ncbi:UDP-2,4-diacetamido-2,4,6-trideoxy-beta-L-altropyranose hydrolase [Dongia sedimenti]|uniref:UDP-2,4-diacetamido-2,4, 6-trideoxy-beta-L-altropyranose hydrolase n=1 Tax=Dongia sedimenti TaxID=3064282 RepID=A0ABU0YEW5_9PROT|nr:UDP-2,4-diacetamido-2,4,6-trideoxy-beta-L-altropyranose hydrolase [Rhodospirillaceae bacterium R-7]
MTKTVAIIQARFGSTRLPGKVLKPLGSISGGQGIVLDHAIRRCRAIPSVDAVVIATTDREEDGAIVAAAERAGAQVHRGSAEDVLSRYAGAARRADADVVLRVTSDCPLIDPGICDRVIRLRAEAGVDYAANNMPRLYPHGLDCEVFTREGLERADKVATAPYDREHVTPWLRRAADVTRASLIGPGWPAVQQRWTLDFPEDYDFFAALFPLLPQGRIAGMDEVLGVLAEHPEIVAINAHRRIGGPTAKPSSAPAAVFRFEADQKTGFGHAMRSNAFATLLDQLGWRVFWAISESSIAFLRESAPPGAVIDVTEPAAEAQAAKILRACGGSCDLLVVDHYCATLDLETAMSARGATVAVFDDLIEAQSDADVILNPAPNIASEAYGAIARPETRFLLGPDNAVLRAQFPAMRTSVAARIAERRRIGRVLIAFGGTDPVNGTGIALGALEATDIQEIDVILGAKAVYLDAVREQAARMGGRVNLMLDVAEVAAAMARADLVIGAPGTGTWERACLGLPSLLVVIAANQKINAETVVARGAALVCGSLGTDPEDKVAASLRASLERLRNDPALYHHMHEAALALSDGRGSLRLAAAVVPAMRLKDGTPLVLRLAEMDDARLLYDWQQAPETRRYALNQNPFSFDDHCRWLTAKLANGRDLLLIGEAGGKPAGFIRLDWFGADKDRTQYLVSIAAAPGQHGRGVGTALLNAARALAPGAHFYAQVLAQNAASLALFRGCGYALGPDGYYHSGGEV